MDLLHNPFHILSATPRDNRQRIMELYDERSLLIDSSECMKARSDLMHPMKRLSAEVAWLPGLSPKHTEKVFNWLSNPVQTMPPQTTLKALSPSARGNILATGLKKFANHSSSSVAEWILALAWAFEEIVVDDLFRVINEERIVSGFPEVTELSAVEAEVHERRHFYRQVIKAALDHLSAKDLVDSMVFVVESATDNGKENAPILIDDLVDSYEVEAQAFLEKEEGNIKSLVDKLKAAADDEQSDSKLSPMVSQLTQVVKNWDFVAQPIQVSSKSRGLNHNPSYRVAALIRELAIHLFNEHGKLDFSQQLTNMLQEVFAEVGEVAESTAEDANALAEIAEDRKIKRLIEPIIELCNSSIENSQKDPSNAATEAQRVIDAAPLLISRLASKKVPTELLLQGKDKLALTIFNCSIIYGNHTEKWKPCITFLEEALKLSVNSETRANIEKNLQTVRENDRMLGNLKPINSAPSLRTVNGFGFTLYGCTEMDVQTRSYLSTYYFVIFWIPIFPICRYRVISTGSGYSFLGKAPLRTFDKLHLFISLCIVSWFIFTIVAENYSSSGSIKSSGQKSAKNKSDNVTPQSSVFKQLPEELPVNGWIQRYHSGEAIAPLRIVTRSQNVHYFVKIVDYYSNRNIASVFVRGGSSVDLDVPLGSYKLKYASGDTWYGNKYLFGPRTNYSMAEKKFDFNVVGNRVSGYTVELFMQSDGNLATSRLSASDF